MMTPRRHYDYLMSTPGAPMLDAAIRTPWKLMELAAMAKSENNMALAAMLQHLVLWHNAGRTSVVVEKTLQEVFTRMTCDQVPQEMIKFPAPSVYMCLPDCEWRIWGGVTGWHKVRGVYVVYDMELSADEQRRGVKMFDRGDWTDHAHVMLWGEPNGVSVETYDNDALFWTSISISEGQFAGGFEKALVRKLDETPEHVLRGGNMKSQAVVTGADLRKETNATMVNVFRLMFNAFAYMATNPRDVLVESNRAAVERHVKEMKERLARVKSGKAKKLQRQMETGHLRTPAVETTTWIGPTLQREISEERAKCESHGMRWHPVRPYWNTFHTKAGPARKFVYVPNGRGDRALGVVKARMFRFVEDKL